MPYNYNKIIVIVLKLIHRSYNKSYNYHQIYGGLYNDFMCHIISLIL